MKKSKKIITYILVFVLGCFIMYALAYKYPDFLGLSLTKYEKNVTITDKGISDSVEKVYDSVVVVTTYVDAEKYASGTGFVFKKDGNKAYILTNNHVISSAKNVTVSFTDGKVVEADIVGSDELSDIAVLSVNSKEIISIAQIGKSDNLRVGDTAFAVGAPLDSVYSWTVTRGIISGKDRMVEVAISSKSNNYVMKVLQTDAAINSGNSGGPLCNSNGEVIGITSLKLVDTSVEGMGFAIPIETAMNYAEKLINGDKIKQPYIGVSMVNVSEAYYYQEFYKVLSENKITAGVVVYEVEKGSPADKAGIKKNDVILKINDDEITNIAYFRYYLYNYEVGEKVNITINREGKEKRFTVELGTNSKTY